LKKALITGITGQEGSFTLIATVECNCQTFVIEKIITVSAEPDASFNATVTSDVSNSIYNPISATALFPENLSEWQIFPADNCGINNIDFDENSPLRPVQSGPNVTYVGSTAPQLQLSNCYVIRYRVWSDNGGCFDEFFYKFGSTTNGIIKGKYFSERTYGTNSLDSELKRNESESKVLLFPNPTQESMQVDWSMLEYESTEVARIVIYDLRGRELKSVVTGGDLNMLRINTNDLVDGIYVLELIDKRSMILESKLFEKF